jgi:hypothetical protein
MGKAQDPPPRFSLLTFALWTVGTAVVLIGLVMWLKSWILSVEKARSILASIAFFTPTTWMAVAVASLGSARGLLKRFLSGSGVKLLLSLVFLVWGFFEFRDEKMTFVLSFMGVYVIFTTLEVVHIMINLRRNS